MSLVVFGPASITDVQALVNVHDADFLIQDVCFDPIR